MSAAAASIAAERLLDPEAAADHLSNLYRLAWSLCGSRHLAEELTQETYVRVLAKPRRLKGNDFHYLARTLRNVLSDHWRAERRRPVPVSDDVLADELHADGVGDPEAASRVKEVYAEIGRLPGHLREVVAAVDVAGLTYAEAAEALRIPHGTVMSRLYRARERLAGVLAA
jgi:RNA polymerase sigma-70 factor, ECF subfamily